MRDAYPFGLFAVPQKDVARIHASSRHDGPGHGGGPYGERPQELGRLLRPRHRTWWAATRTPPSRCPTATACSRAAWARTPAARPWAARSSPPPRATRSARVQMMKDCGTDILACTPSYALLIADTAIEMGYDPATEFKISGGIFGAEPASEKHARGDRARSWASSTATCTASPRVMGPGVAMECAERARPARGRGPLLLPRSWTPRRSSPLPDGEWGELVITTLTRECCPLVRYRTRDVTRIISEAVRVRAHPPQDRPHARAAPTTCSSSAA